jgi:ABC-type polysaccharide/polyol phosphate transport system ATPase subunit
MSDVIISLAHVGKKFCRSLKRTLGYGAQDVARDILGLTPDAANLRPNEFWALDDVSFEVKRGECVGLIGPNGAGKSTILKLLNGVILPDKGTIHLRGRVGGLLELGAGFHPMLTGRENIRLSGAILGLSRYEIDRKFDSIVEFAGLYEFIDTPVKYYSSGMYVRLGFSVAISRDPDILVVDEALAVGDAAFKRRCLEHIDAFIKAGRTIIFVSHNFQEIDRVTTRALLLDRGRIIAGGPSETVIADYLKLLSNRQRQERRQRATLAGEVDTPVIEILDVAICGAGSDPAFCFRTRDSLEVRIRFIAHQVFTKPVFRVQFYRSDGLFCYGTNTERHEIDLGRIEGEGVITLNCPDLSLLAGDYSIRVAVLSTQYDEIPIHQWVVSPGIHVESTMRDGGGVFAMRAEWSSATIVER